jgi:hypothetical protein
MPERLKDILSDILIVGEGAGDAALIRHLTDDRGITGFQIEEAGGNTKFQSFINGLPARTGFKTRLKALVVVADTDGGADESFKNIAKQMKAEKFPCSHAPYKVAKLPHIDYVTYILMIPFAKAGEGITPITGALETLLLPSAEQHLSRFSQCLDDWCNCVQMSGWSKTHQDKARLRSLIAAAYPQDPNCGLQWALKPDKNLIPLNHPSFDDLADLLRRLPETLFGQ